MTGATTENGAAPVEAVSPSPEAVAKMNLYERIVAIIEELNDYSRGLAL